MAGMSIAAVMVTASVDYYLLALTAILLAVLWCVYNPFVFAVLLLPSFIPFQNVVLAPGWDLSLLRVLTVVVGVCCLSRWRAFSAAARAAPTYVWVGFGGVLVADLISLLANDFPGGSVTPLVVLFVRLVQFLIIWVAVMVMPDGRLVLWGLGLAGLSNAVSALYVWKATGSFIAARSLPFGLGTSLGAAALVSNLGAIAVVGGVALIALPRGWSRGVASSAILTAMGTAIALSSLSSGRREALVALGLAAGILLVVQPGWVKAWLAILALVGTCWMYSAGPLREFIAERESIFGEFQGEGTGRMPLLAESWRAWLERPWFGSGPGTHEALMLSRGLLPGGVAAHNSITGSFVEDGILGGASAMWLVLGFSLQWWRALWGSRQRHSPGWPPTMLAGAASILTVFVVGNFLSSTAYIVAFALLSAWVSRTLRAQLVDS